MTRADRTDEAADWAAAAARRIFARLQAADPGFGPGMLQRFLTRTNPSVARLFGQAAPRIGL